MAKDRYGKNKYLIYKNTNTKSINTKNEFNAFLFKKKKKNKYNNER